MELRVVRLSRMEEERTDIIGYTIIPTEGAAPEKCEK
jgi:hypothetical protein